jgi:hypothetical protein
MTASALSAQQFSVHELAPPDEESPLAVVAFSGKPGHPTLVVGGSHGRSWMLRMEHAYQLPLFGPGQHQLIGDAPTAEPGTGRPRSARPGHIDLSHLKLERTLT